jgi:hypothetical protein
MVGYKQGTQSSLLRQIPPPGRLSSRSLFSHGCSSSV